MDFRYLGPLEVVLSGERVAALGGPRQRSVLAVLLLLADRVVTTGMVEDKFWCGEPPDTAIAYVHNAVSRLRKALGPHVLETRPGGYVLYACAEEINAL